MNKKLLLYFSISCVIFLSGIHFLTLGIRDDFSEINSIEVYFSPKDNIKKILIDLINEEKIYIKMASFRFTDKDILKALLLALQRGVKLEIVTDKGCLGAAYSKILSLHKMNIPIYIFPPVYEEIDDQKNCIKIEFLCRIKNIKKNKKRALNTGLMHNKFFLFYSLGLVFTGSYNFTEAANSINQENALIISNESVFKKYNEYFDQLKVISSKIF